MAFFNRSPHVRMPPTYNAVGPAPSRRRQGDTPSLLSRALYLWVSPILEVGNDRQLERGDLWPLTPEQVCQDVSKRFEQTFAQTNSILWTIFRIHGPRFALVGCVQVVVVGCMLYAPFVLHEIVAAAAAPTFDIAQVLQVVFALYVVKVVQAFLNVHANFQVQLITLKVTSALQHLLFQKALVLDASCRRDKSSGEIANMFSTDIQTIVNFSVGANQLWLFPLQTISILYMLHSVIGLAAFVGAGVIVIVLFINNCLATTQRAVFRKLMDLKDARMKAVGEVFGAMQIIKLNAWEEKFYDKLSGLRGAELRTLRTVFSLQSVWVALLLAAPIFVTIASLGTYTLVLHKTLSAAKVFTALSLFSMLRFPMMALPQVIANLMQALVATRRIRDFLALQEKDTTEVWTPATHPTEARAFAGLDIALRHGTFGWTADAPLFQGLNLSIAKGELVVVHGVVGAGKSSLLAALLGEMHKAPEGQVFLGGDVAYFSQQPWIQNMTIRENILFGRPYNRQKYTAVLEACALAKDLALFPAGDRTEIGQKGVNVSGGQKARISLARACYSDADIFLLDSPLSAVDAIVQNDIFTKCFLGLLAKKTVVLVTHCPEIIASKLVDRTLEVRAGVVVDTKVDRDPAGPPPVSPFSRCSSAADDEPRTPDEPSPLPPAYAAATYAYDEETSPTGQLIFQELRGKGRVAAKIFRTYVAAIGGPKMLLLWSVFLLAGQAMQVAGDLRLGSWSADAADAAAPWYLGSYAGLALGGILCCALRTVSIFVGGLRASRALFDRMSVALLQAPMQFFDTTPLGRILNRFSNDISTVDVQLPMLLDPLTGVLFAVLVQLTTTVCVIKAAGLLLLPLVYVYMSMACFYVPPAREMERLAKTTKSPLLNLVAEAIDGALVIRAFGHAARFQTQHQANVDATTATAFAAQAMTQWFALRVQLLSAHLVLVVSLSLVYMRGLLSPGLVGLVLNYAFNMLPSLEYIVSIGAQVETAMVGPERLAEYCAVPTEPPRVVPGSVPQAWPAAGAIAIRNVSFRYKAWDPLVLKNVELSIAAGEKIGIVARAPASGRIEIDGVDVARVGVKTLRSRIAIIPQNPVLFKGSLRSYLDLFDEFTDDTLWTALRKVHLRDRIARAGGLEALVDENGENFSVGERQMLCMARALLRQAKIVVMDEATAAIDHATDLTLQRVIRTEFAASTVLTIAHRLDTVLDCDRIVVFDAGRVAQCDSPQALIDAGAGIFYELCQEGGYLDKVLAQASPK
ncbi:ATP-binding Cassette (ABC) Superfamily [Achlya hypogyna]|uniref:ATP-binding Cassette (ABC) Superfamily n=1 Tax=Achlya hypogyna TaxID=1202772 RepID=A0A1V9ZKN5_ACHHY|nr:ATP-binding Cassette (ABC) Superfamily [Achlya hypogyna]